MTNLSNHTNKLILTLSVLSLVLANQSAKAEIYKWRDAGGRIKYSDRPPVEGFTKASRQEIINALQAKDLCVVPANSNTAKSLSEYKANFFGFGSPTNPLALNQPTGITNIGAVTASKAAAARITPFAAARPVAAKVATSKPATYAPLSATSFFNFGTQAVTVFSFLVKPAAPKALPAAQIVAQAAPQPAAAVAPAQAATPAPVTLVATAAIATATALPTTNAANLIQVAQMPTVDINKNVPQAVGYSDLRIVASALAKDQAPVGDGHGQFRIDCEVSHMSNDDPIVYPNQPGAAHHHTFFGNTTTNNKTNVATLSSAGNSTCRGGIANRSAYWIPSMIDTSTDTPMKPKGALWYYKTSAFDKSLTTAPPKGLRMIAGNMKATSAQASRFPEFTCQMPNINDSPPATKYIPACPQGGTIVSHVAFPDCWDGVNLDSPDHHSHMTEGNGTCPASHPVAIPLISLNTYYAVSSPSGTRDWRLASDNYTKDGYNAGFSSHADWINGWDESVMVGIVKNCLNRGVDCGNHMLGDGTIIY